MLTVLQTPSAGLQVSTSLGEADVSAVYVPSGIHQVNISAREDRSFFIAKLYSYTFRHKAR
jgi:hypothetical protein